MNVSFAFCLMMEIVSIGGVLCVCPLNYALNLKWFHQRIYARVTRKCVDSGTITVEFIDGHRIQTMTTGCATSSQFAKFKLMEFYGWRWIQIGNFRRGDFEKNLMSRIFIHLALWLSLSVFTSIMIMDCDCAPGPTTFGIWLCLTILGPLYVYSDMPCYLPPRYLPPLTASSKRDLLNKINTIRQFGSGDVEEPNRHMPIHTTKKLD